MKNRLHPDYRSCSSEELAPPLPKAIESMVFEDIQSELMIAEEFMELPEWALRKFQRLDASYPRRRELLTGVYYLDPTPEELEHEDELREWIANNEDLSAETRTRRVNQFEAACARARFRAGE